MATELTQVTALALKKRCPGCGAVMTQAVVDDELCWVCPTPCGQPPIPVNG